jgi:hypothetical protein
MLLSKPLQLSLISPTFLKHCASASIYPQSHSVADTGMKRQVNLSMEIYQLNDTAFIFQIIKYI